MNYIEYARRLAQGSDKGEAAQALTRLILAHGATLSAGQSVGINTGDWVFTSPMAYGGGPLMQSITSVPEAVGNWEDWRGDEARREIGRQFYPGLVPGGNAFRTIWKAVNEDDPDLYLRVLGFTPLTDKEAQHGYHQFVP